MSVIAKSKSPVKQALHINSRYKFKMKFNLNKVKALMFGATFVCSDAQVGASIAVGKPSFDLGCNPAFPHYAVHTGCSSAVGTTGVNDPSGPVGIAVDF